MHRRLIVLGLSASTLLLLAVAVLFLRSGELFGIQLPAEAAERISSDLIFIDSDQTLGNSDSHDVALGDLDGDGDLDAFVANYNSGNRIWLNDGNGFFTASQQWLGTARSQAVALGELDGVNGLDAFIANSGQSNRVWLNDGRAGFEDSGQAFDPAPSNDVALGELDGEEGLDAFVVNGASGGTANSVWLNNGTGLFSSTLPSLGSAWSEGISLGKLDGDDNLDAFIANGGSVNNPPDEVWFNIGSAVFTNTGQSLANSWTTDVALAKLDQNDSLDGFTVNWGAAGNRVWINDGSGTFTDNGQLLGNASSTAVDLGDIDGDDDVDALVGNWQEANRLWLNDGQGVFSDSGLGLGDSATWSVALGDLDGDGDLDAFIGNSGPNEVWFNGNRASFDVGREKNDLDQDVFYSSNAETTLPVLLQQPATQPVTVHVGVKSSNQATTETVLFEVGQQLMMLNLVRSQPGPSEEHLLTLYLTSGSESPAPENQTDRLSFSFIDQVQGPQECLLCFNEWLGRILGFNPIFGALHHLELADQRDSAQWRYYSKLFQLHTQPSTISRLLLRR
jgi:hypothetical protein